MRQRAGAVIYPESVDLVDRSERPVTVGVLDKILRVGEGKTLRRLVAIAAAVNAIEDEFVSLTDAELRALTEEFKKRYQGGESLDDLLPEAFATVREAARRTLGQRHYDVQIMGGAALHMGNIAEMRTVAKASGSRSSSDSPP